jgi:DNA-binding LacI/PurR family transcriptional regulator
VPFVGLDLAEAGRLAAQHLLSLGCQKFGYLIDRKGSLNGELRMRRYRSTIEDAGFEIDPAFVFEHAFAGEWNDYKSGYAAGEAIARLESRPEAMYCFNDLGALGLEDALLDAGLRVPGDVAIVGIDDIELAARARVPLTTVRQPVDVIGARSVDNILARLRGERPEVRQLLEPVLIIRSSTGSPVAVAAEDR